MRFLTLFILVISFSLGSCDFSDSSSANGIYDVEADDLEMLATVKQARATLPQFLDAVQHHDTSSSNFAVKIPFADGEQEEYIWLGEPALEDG